MIPIANVRTKKLYDSNDKCRSIKLSKRISFEMPLEMTAATVRAMLFGCLKLQALDLQRHKS